MSVSPQTSVSAPRQRPWVNGQVVASEKLVRVAGGTDVQAELAKVSARGWRLSFPEFDPETNVFVASVINGQGFLEYRLELHITMVLLEPPLRVPVEEGWYRGEIKANISACVSPRGHHYGDLSEANDRLGEHCLSCGQKRPEVLREPLTDSVERRLLKANGGFDSFGYLHD